MKDEVIKACTTPAETAEDWQHFSGSDFLYTASERPWCESVKLHYKF